MLISVTRLRLRRAWFLPKFLLLNRAVEKECAQSGGFVEGRELLDWPFVFWTLSLWRDEQAMRAFRSNGAHATAMKWLALHCDEAAIAHWTTDSAELPAWEEAYRRLVEEGRSSRVERPSERHAGRTYQPPRVRVVRRINALVL